MTDRCIECAVLGWPDIQLPCNVHPLLSLETKSMELDPPESETEDKWDLPRSSCIIEKNEDETELLKQQERATRYILRAQFVEDVEEFCTSSVIKISESEVVLGDQIALIEPPFVPLHGFRFEWVIVHSQLPSRRISSSAQLAVEDALLTDPLDELVQ